MSPQIVLEAMLLVLTLRLRGALRREPAPHLVSQP
jgi:hypothetical protein